METGRVTQLWVPEQPHNQAAKLECLKLASATSKDADKILKTAKAMYSWVSDGAKNA